MPCIFGNNVTPQIFKKIVGKRIVVIEAHRCIQNICCTACQHIIPNGFFKHPQVRVSFSGGENGHPITMRRNFFELSTIWLR